MKTNKHVLQGWGVAIILGIHPTPRLLPLHPMELFDGRRIVASVFGDFRGKSQLPLFAKQCMAGVNITCIFSGVPFYLLVKLLTNMEIRW